MKMKYWFSLCLLPFILSSCQKATTENTSGGNSSYLMSGFQIKVRTDYSYDISFSLSKDLQEGDVFFFSDDALLDDTDTKADYTGNKDFITLNYTLFDNDFYLLIVDKDNQIRGKENLVIPTFNMYINQGKGNNSGNDIISFSYLENGYSANNFFDVGGICIYRSSTTDFKNSSTEIVLENATISDEFIATCNADKPYYLFTSSFGQNKGIYQSQVFRENSSFGKDLVTFSSLGFENKDKISLKATGVVNDKNIKNFSLLLINQKNSFTYYQKATINQDYSFTCLLDLSVLEKPQTSYMAYLVLSSGVYSSIDYPFSSESLPEKISYDEKIYSFYNENGQLSVIFSNKAAVNILKAEIIEENDKVYFVSEGTIDRKLFPLDPTTGKIMDVASPVLSVVSDSKINPEKQPYAITVLGDSFSVKADLTLLTQLGPWYSLKLYFNTNMGTDASGNQTYVNNYTYEYLLSDANNYSQMVFSETTLNRYRFRNYDSFLKLEIKDYSASLYSFDYVNIDGRMNLRLKGSFRKGESYIDIYTSSEEKSITHFKADIITDEDYNFQVDIDINDIKSYTNYSIHWIGAQYGDNEITNEFLETVSAVNSSADGFMFCVKTESYQTTSYYKVFKDKDNAKATDISFISKDNEPQAMISGYVNSLLDKDSLYLQLNYLVFGTNGNNIYPENPLLTKLAVKEDNSFTSLIDLTNMVKERKYQLKVVQKVADSYVDISNEHISYCAFYPEYLPLDYGIKSLVTSNGTYRIKNFQGMNSHWELYLILI